jgi:hypothetical protein
VNCLLVRRTADPGLRSACHGTASLSSHPLFAALLGPIAVGLSLQFAPLRAVLQGGPSHLQILSWPVGY